MTKETNGEASSEIIPKQLGYSSRFRFNCHKGVTCFTKCCRGIDIMLTPYDIITMRKRLDLTSEEFLAYFTDLRILEKADLPIVTMKLLDDERKSCPFVHDEDGCAIYEDRPSTCRYYPLGMGSLSYSKEIKEKEEFFFMVKENHCRGFEEDKEWTVAEWRQDQGVDVRDEVNAGWTDLIVRKKSIPLSLKMTDQAKQLFFMACYNPDKFREFVLNTSFLKRFPLDAETAEAIKTDDVALVKMGFEWMKSILFDDGHITPKPEAVLDKKEDASS